jgi:hypothetical protein
MINHDLPPTNEPIVLDGAHDGYNPRRLHDFASVIWLTSGSWV